jgi:hypothetical protein
MNLPCQGCDSLSNRPLPAFLNYGLGNNLLCIQALQRVCNNMTSVTTSVPGVAVAITDSCRQPPATAFKSKLPAVTSRRTRYRYQPLPLGSRPDSYRKKFGRVKPVQTVTFERVKHSSCQHIQCTLAQPNAPVQLTLVAHTP